MTGTVATLRRAWGEFVGPEATPVNHALTALTTLVGAVAAPAAARARGADSRRAAAAFLLAVDLSGGAYVNNTRACARWYERPGQGDGAHYAFASLHVHPAAVAWLDAGTAGPGGRRVHPAVWAAAQYGYLMAATVVVRRNPARRRVLGVALTAGGLALDAALGPSRVAPWFAWTYYPKLVLGHASAALWSDEDLAPA
ncbi:hypothetical protein [Krasilnikoviella flava]|uniref:Uncharacterized protein n=1 Tax=Krasilnikoviella flava TaxID=526729 RepID=A0A1T5JLG3_9MICO|nr:hypothetical protein [Krasilnikoviella flava]SKC52249.1 hypothetical protein SAMN04324258_1519 [Krasilnikoviella flava]